MSKSNDKSTLLAVAGFLIVNVLFFVGCGDKFSRHESNTTSVYINPSPENLLNLKAQLGLSFAEQAMVGPTGAQMIFAVNQANAAITGQRYFTSNATASTGQWTIQNGEYYFYYIGYNGANIDNVSRACGQAIGDDTIVGNKVALFGGTKGITINTSGANCSASPLGSGTDAGSFTMTLCNPNSAVANATAIAENCNSGNIGGNVTSAPVANFSVRIMYIEDTSFSGPQYT